MNGTPRFDPLRKLAPSLTIGQVALLRKEWPRGAKPG
jgi:hypothetical protein